jgi:hypothetical protein
MSDTSVGENPRAASAHLRRRRGILLIAAGLVLPALALLVVMVAPLPGGGEGLAMLAALALSAAALVVGIVDVWQTRQRR